MHQSPISPRKILVVGVMALLVIFGAIASFQLFEHLDAEDLMVIQSPFSGTLTWHISPGRTMVRESHQVQEARAVLVLGQNRSGEKRR